MSLFGSLDRLPLSTDHKDFPDLEELEQDLICAVDGWDAFEERLRGFFRSAIDEVIDTARTGRFFFAELEKTEKTYLGTKFEILLRDWLGVPRGLKLDLLIGGEEVDVKSSTSAATGGWMIPPEAIDELCILIKVNEAEAVCDFGLARARREYLRSGSNRDAKTGFSAAGRQNIWWMAKSFEYTKNFWAMIGDEDRQYITSRTGGTKRIVALFERCQGIGISRVQIAAVARQADYMKRMRGNGGARDHLSPQGIAVLYSEADAALMRTLGLKFGTNEFVSYKAKSSQEFAMLREAGRL